LAAILIAIAAPAFGAPTFFSSDPRLPNPDRPYVMQERAHYGPLVAIDELTIQVANPEQLDFPTRTPEGAWEFDSTFDVNYSAILSIGLAPPVFVTGTGTAHALGETPANQPLHATLVYDTELLALDLVGPPGFRFRESPTLRSTGVTTVDGFCPVCDGPFFGGYISSFFDVFSEVSIDGGTTWVPASGSFRIEQIPEPATFWLVPICGAGIGWQALSRERRAARRGAAG
jgi:hypothetical protein